MLAAAGYGASEPMLGTRGVRIGVLKPGLYRCGAGVVEGAMDRAKDAATGVEILIPLTSDGPSWPRRGLVTDAIGWR